MSENVTASRRNFLRITSGAILSTQLVPGVGLAALGTAAIPQGRGQSLDQGWHFLQGDGQGFERTDFDDANWRVVDVPHDWSIEDLPGQSTGPKPEVIGPFSRKAPGGTATGFAVGGTGWYRKRFTVTAPPGARVEVRFDGVYMNCEVWCNGKRLGEFPGGYTPFGYDLTPLLNRGDENVLAVKVRNEGVNSRWYSGSGIYRHVWLDVFAEPSRIAPWGTSVDTQSVVDGRAQLEVTTKLADLRAGLTLVSKIKDPKGKVVWQSKTPATALVRTVASVPSAALWSPESPAMYTLVSELRSATRLVDKTETAFGIRIVTFDVVNGMTINGVPTKLKGGCIHHDNGLLGAKAFDAAEDRKVRLLKARGYNAVRASHNPFSEAFLSACDRHGMFVIAEAFDSWRLPKQPDDYSRYFDARWKDDLATLVISERHHPSIIMWSIGNEIPGRNLPAGVELQWQLTNLVHELDSYRPVTAAINDFIGRPLIPAPPTAREGQAGKADEASVLFLDVVGYNYKLRKYERDHALYPSRIMYGSESFPRDMFATWALAAKAPYLIGDFVWTAMDYLGEAGVGGFAHLAPSAAAFGAPPAWPLVVSSCGDLDLIGCQRSQSYARDVAWGLSHLEMLVQTPVPDGKIEVIRNWGWSDENPDWTWPGLEGKTMSVRVYTSGDRVELSLNGEPVATRNLTDADLMRAEFKVPYAPGKLEAVAFRGTTQIGHKVIETTGKVATLAVQPESKRVGASRNDIAYVAIALKDAQGRHVHRAELPVRAVISGPAELIAFGSAAHSATGSYQSETTRTFDGRAQLILRSTGRKGPVRVSVECEGLTGSAEIQFI